MPGVFVEELRGVDVEVGHFGGPGGDRLVGAEGVWEIVHGGCSSFGGRAFVAGAGWIATGDHSKRGAFEKEIVRVWLRSVGLPGTVTTRESPGCVLPFRCDRDTDLTELTQYLRWLRVRSPAKSSA